MKNHSEKCKVLRVELVKLEDVPEEVKRNHKPETQFYAKEYIECWCEELSFGEALPRKEEGSGGRG